MLIKACILNGQHCVHHDGRDVLERSQVATLLAELANLLALDREHTHGQFGFVVRQVRDIGQLGVGHGQRHGNDQQTRQQTRSQQTQTPTEKTDQQTCQGRTRAVRLKRGSAWWVGRYAGGHSVHCRMQCSVCDG